MYCNHFRKLLVFMCALTLGMLLSPALVLADDGPPNEPTLTWYVFLPFVSREQNPSRALLMRCQQGLFRSADGGDTWQQLGSLSGQLIALDYGNPGRILWARNNGLWASTDRGETWIYVGTLTTTVGVTLIDHDIVGRFWPDF